MNAKIFRCPVCGNVMLQLVDSGVVPRCCNEDMQVLSARTTDDEEHMREKHVPELDMLNECTIRVRIGSEPHPSTDEHHICFNMLVSEHGVQIHFPRIGQNPTSTFYCGHDRPVAIYSYCNLHNLWAKLHMPPTLQNCPK